MTANGKLDTRALPAPEYQDVDGYRAPASAVEEILVGIYADVLGVERVGVDDSFFDLGGDSLLAMRLSAAINTSLDADLSVPTVFDAPTVAQLARRIGVGSRRLQPLVAVERPAVVPLSLPSSGCGSSTSCRGPPRSTTWRRRCGWVGSLMPRSCVRRWPMWWAAMKACARCLPRPRESPSSW